MASQHSLNLDKENAVHYYHCILFNVPFDLALSDIAPLIMPRAESAAVGHLAKIGCRVVPHQLHMYKEPLETKFGYATFFVNQTQSMVGHDGIHDFVLEWISSDLKEQLDTVNVKVALAQPPECHSSVPFLCALNQQCYFIDPRFCRDSKKLETFLLSKVLFIDDARHAHKNRREETDSSIPQLDSEDPSSCDWKAVGSLKVSSLTSKEIMWLKREHSRFTDIKIISDDPSQSICDNNNLISLLKEALSPLIDVIV